MINRIFAFMLMVSCNLSAQVTNITVFPNQLSGPVGSEFTNGVFFVPKTAPAMTDFLTNAAPQTAIRTNVIETAMNSTTNIQQCLTLLQSVQGDLVNLSQRTDRMIFIFEKMPPWLSSSNNGAPASTPGWSVLNTKPPADWDDWRNAVDSITGLIVGDMNIQNAYFEIWNEPDLGSWTGTQDEYWMLYKTSYDAIKAAAPTAKVGGPAVNGWANNIYWQPPYGFVDDATARLSLIGQLLDSSIIWNRIPDFISWHNFSMCLYEHNNACDFIQMHCSALSIQVPELIISEWNAPSAVRDSPLAASYAGIVPIHLRSATVSCNVFAAWQDFSPSANEFHSDYGLLTYGAIHKPVHYTRLLHEKIIGSYCSTVASQDCHIIAAVQPDTVNLLIANYMPPPIFEGLNAVLWNSQSNVNDLDSLGYINLLNNDLSVLDSVFNGLIVITPSNATDSGIIASIPLYQHYLNYFDTIREFQFLLAGVLPQTTLNANVFVIDSSHNNMKSVYDSLIAAGFTQPNAINFITATQNLESESISLPGGSGTIQMQPNALCLISINVPGVSSFEEDNSDPINYFPNPVTDRLFITGSEFRKHDEFNITDVAGKVVANGRVSSDGSVYCGNLPPGLYYIHFNDAEYAPVRIVKM